MSPHALRARNFGEDFEVKGKGAREVLGLDGLEFFAAEDGLREAQRVRQARVLPRNVSEQSQGISGHYDAPVNDIVRTNMVISIGD